MTTQPTIDSFLSRWYAAAHGLSAEPMSKVQSDYQAAASLDPTLKTAAQAKLASLPDLPDGRDVISSTQRKFLNLVLGTA